MQTSNLRVAFDGLKDWIDREDKLTRDQLQIDRDKAWHRNQAPDVEVIRRNINAQLDRLEAEIKKRLDQDWGDQ